MNITFLKKYINFFLLILIFLLITGYIIGLSDIIRILLGILAGVLIYAGSKTIIDLTLDQYKTIGKIAKSLFEADQFLRNDWKNVPGLSEIERTSHISNNLKLFAEELKDRTYLIPSSIYSFLAKINIVYEKGSLAEVYDELISLSLSFGGEVLEDMKSLDRLKGLLGLYGRDDWI
jgi:hypothetical protein